MLQRIRYCLPEANHIIRCKYKDKIQSIDFDEVKVDIEFILSLSMYLTNVRELLFEVKSFPTLEHLKTLASNCKTLKYLDIDSKSICLSDSKYYKTDVIGLWDNLEYAGIHYLQNAINPYCNNIATTFKSIKDVPSQGCDQSFIKTFPNLEKLSLNRLGSDIQSELIESSNCNVKYLELINCKLDMQIFYDILSRLKQMRKLDLIDCSFLFGNSLKSDVYEFPAIEEASCVLYNSMLMHDHKLLLEFLSNCPNLQYLSLTIAKHWILSCNLLPSTLKRLKLQICQSFFPFEIISDSCHFLEHLEIICSGENAIMLKSLCVALQSMKSLKCLILKGFNLLSLISIMSIELPTLLELNIIQDENLLDNTPSHSYIPQSYIQKSIFKIQSTNSSKLERLKLDDISLSFCSWDLLLGNFSQLTYLSLSIQNDAECLTKAPNVSKGRAMIRNILKHCKLLKELNLANRFLFYGMAAICESYHENLRVVNLSKSLKVIDIFQVNEDSISRCLSLREISLRNSDINDHQLKLISKACPNLQKLDISLCRNITDSSLHELALCNKELRTVILSIGNNLTEKGLSFLSSKNKNLIVDKDASLSKSISKRNIAYLDSKRLKHCTEGYTAFGESFL